MKNYISRFILIVFDILAIFISIILAFYTREMATVFIDIPFHKSLDDFFNLYVLFITTIGMLIYEGIYSKRLDFWHESRQIIKSLLFAFLLVMAYLAITKSVGDFSRLVIFFIFIYLAFLLPLFKFIIKKQLFRLGIWQRKAKVYGDNSFLKEEIFNNHYLGYIDAKDDTPTTVFINSHNEELNELKDIIDKEISQSHEVIFIPLINEYDLTRSHIYHLSNTRTNLIIFQNRLKSKFRLWLKKSSDIVMAILVFPIILPLLIYIAYKIRKEEPNSSILFKQERLGQDGEIFVCYKFRSMFEQSDEILSSYLKANPDEVEYYATYHKYQNDPRITKIGDKLRRTSLDELPQIFNVFKNEMSFIGPRPYMTNEKEKIGKNVDTVLTVKPGITGLWQVSGRSEIDFHSRVKLDIWYVRNWTLWMDLVILIKTIKTVLFKDGAY